MKRLFEPVASCRAVQLFLLHALPQHCHIEKKGRVICRGELPENMSH